MNNKFILDNMVFSYSRLDTYERCPKCFYLQYIQELKGVSGVFAEFGSLLHDILERYAKKELETFELVGEYIKNFPIYITSEFPLLPNIDLKIHYYNQGLSFFENFGGYENINILGVENSYIFNIDKYKFTGKIDLETDNQITDYKTKGISQLKLLKRFTKNHNKEDYVDLLDGRYLDFKNFIQIYLYCIPYYNKYKQFPKTLKLDMIRIGDSFVINFNQNDFEKAKAWAINVINNIYNTDKFIKSPDIDKGWCNFTCSQRFNCVHSDRYIYMGGQ